MIELRNVTKRYGRRVALDDVSLTLTRGEVALLLGANGAGKSTLLRCLLGISDYEGAIAVDGLDPLTSGCRVRAAIGYMPQSGGLHGDLSVRDTVTLYARIRQAPIDRGLALIREAGLAHHLDAAVGELSGGLRQRLGFALALLPNPRLLILDEPSASLDRASRQWLAERLRAAAAEGRTILISTHADQQLIDVPDRTITLEAGRIIDDRRRNARTTAAGCAAAITAPAHAPRRFDRVSPIAEKEMRDAFTNRWVVVYALLLGALGLTATATGLDSGSGLAIQAFGRTTATLMNLCLLLSPLVAVVMGAALIAGEQERGTLEHLLAQPLTRMELLLGKYCGLLVALSGATAAGFVPAGVAIGVAAGPAVIGHYLLFPAIAILAGAAMASVGVLISVASRSAVHAQGMAMLTWFAFVLLYDLVLMGSLSISGMPAEWLAVALVGNPVDAARVLGVLALEPDLYLLGPAGAFLTTRLSAPGTAALLLGAVSLWTIVPVAAATLQFSVRRRSNVYADSKLWSRLVSGSARRGDRMRIAGGVARVRS